MEALLEFLKKYNHWLLFLLLEAVGAVLLFRYNRYQGSTWISSANTVAGRVNSVSARAKAYLTLEQANGELTARNFYLERQVTQLRRLYGALTRDTTAAERQELQMLSHYRLVPAKVVSNELHRPDNLMTIDRGAADGIEVGMGVASGLGIVGVTCLVADHYSVVLPVLNTSSHISCAIRGRGCFGVLRWDGKDTSVAYLEDVPRHARFKWGDKVETNGYSSIFPPGVMVGRVETVYNSPDGLSYRVKVRLFTDFGCLSDVLVISDKSIKERVRLLQAARDSLELNVKE